MKYRLRSYLSLLLLAALLCGCAPKFKEPVTFYYLQDTYEEHMTGPIVGEEREVAGHREDLRYLLSFYLIGPIDKTLRSPLPRGTILYSMQEDESGLQIEISNTSEQLTDSEFSLACACLSLTCMGLTDTPEVTITSGSRSITLNHDNLLLTDSAIPEETIK